MCETLLRTTEFACVVAWCEARHPYARGALTQAWQQVLLNQFHDVLPGSCIEVRISFESDLECAFEEN